MKAIRCVKLGGPQDLELQELPDQELGAKEVRVKIEACSVNFPETLIIQGRYQFKPELPFTPGSDIAGVVIEVGAEVKLYKEGMQVFGVVPTGGYADQVVANQREIFPLPQGMDSKVGSTFMMAYGTSYYALKQRAKLQAGETLVILGASGGVGLAAVELGKHMGARVIACASTDEKLALCKAHGADETINYTTEDLKARVKELTGKKGADVIYDAVGGAHAEPAVRSLAWEGRYLVVGFVGGIPKIPLNLLLLKGAAVVGVFWGSHVMREPQAHQENMTELMQLYQQGKIKPHIDKEYSLADAPQALQDMMDRKVKGKVIIVP